MLPALQTVLQASSFGDTINSISTKSAGQSLTAGALPHAPMRPSSNVGRGDIEKGGEKGSKGHRTSSPILHVTN